MAGGEYSESNPLFLGNSSGAARLILYLLIAIVLMAVDHRSRYLEQLRSHLSVLMLPVVIAVELPARLTSWLGTTWGDRTELYRHNQELENELLLAQAQLNRLAALEKENRRLRDLLESSPKLGERVLVAELLAIDLDPFTHRVVLNKGRSDGVYTGQPIADAGGIVGQIDRVGDFTAHAMLISDPSHAIPVVINRTGLRTIAYGTGATDELLLRDISTSADVREGDLLVSSGLGGRFPPGFAVASVTRVTRDPGDAFLTVSARPLAALDRSREVLLVWPSQQEDPTLTEEPDPEEPE